MRTATRASTIVAVLLLWAGSVPRAALRVETLRSTGGLPPHIAGLFEEPLGYSAGGWALRSFGRLRDTGFEQDRELHLALNAGLPLVDPTGGYEFDPRSA